MTVGSHLENDERAMCGNLAADWVNFQPKRPQDKFMKGTDWPGQGEEYWTGKCHEWVQESRPIVQWRGF
jgi:hypothetical protein